MSDQPRVTVTHDDRAPAARPRRSRRLLVAASILAVLLVVLGGVAVAQEEAAPPPATGDEPPAAAQPAEDTSADDAAATPKPIVGSIGVGGDSTAMPTDPADQVVVHITSMTRIVRDHIDEPDKVKQQLKSYINDNSAAMKEAGDRFEARLNELSPDERQAYNEKLQRKMEPALAEFLEAMLDFSARHPEAARELDEMLQTAQ